LHARWKQILAEPPSAHMVHPAGYHSFDIPLWQAVFEGFDPGRTGSCHEVRYPFLHLRLLRYLLAVPVVPWCRAKYLLRRAMRGLLPEPVLRRPKSPLARGPWVECVQQRGLPALIPAPALGSYVDVGSVTRLCTVDADLFLVY